MSRQLWTPSRAWTGQPGSRCGHGGVRRWLYEEAGWVLLLQRRGGASLTAASSLQVGVNIHTAWYCCLTLTTPVCWAGAGPRDPQAQVSSSRRRQHMERAPACAGTTGPGPATQGPDSLRLPLQAQAGLGKDKGQPRQHQHLLYLLCKVSTCVLLSGSGSSRRQQQPHCADLTRPPAPACRCPHATTSVPVVCVGVSCLCRGMCYQGAECPYLHRLPTSADNEAMARTISMDIFGRCSHTHSDLP